MCQHWQIPSRLPPALSPKDNVLLFCRLYRTSPSAQRLYADSFAKDISGVGSGRSEEQLNGGSIEQDFSAPSLSVAFEF